MVAHSLGHGVGVQGDSHPLWPQQEAGKSNHAVFFLLSCVSETALYIMVLVGGQSRISFCIPAGQWELFEPKLHLSRCLGFIRTWHCVPDREMFVRERAELRVF